LLSAYNVLAALDREKYDVLLVGISLDGTWHLYSGDEEKIPDGSWESDIAHLEDSPSFTSGPLAGADIYFPVLHGTFGEDGTIQGLFEMLGKPYVGCGVLASAICMDKHTAKNALRTIGVPVAPDVHLYASAAQADMDGAVSAVEAAFAYPVFVKPSALGSSVGISKAHDRQGLVEAIREAAKYDESILVEQFIDGAEIESAILGNDEPLFCGAGQIIPCHEFYDYEAKYLTGDDSVIVIPAPIPEEALESLKGYAIKAFRELGLSGLARLDFFYTKAGDVILNEINTLPGFTNISMYPKLCEHAGIPYGELVGRLIDLGFERHAQRAKLKYSRN